MTHATANKLGSDPVRWTRRRPLVGGDRRAGTPATRPARDATAVVVGGADAAFSAYLAATRGSRLRGLRRLRRRPHGGFGLFGIPLLLCLCLWSACADSRCPKGMADNGRGRCVSMAADAAVADAAVMGVSTISADDWSRPLASDGGSSDDKPPARIAQVSCDQESCSGDTPVCEPDAGVCVECLTDADCPADPPSLCIDQRCGPCTADGDCQDPAAPRCDLDTGTCQGCAEDSDCADVVVDDRVLAICTESGACAECTGARSEACGRNERGIDYICDSAALRCTTAVSGQASVCGDCLADAHCPAGMRCVPEEVDGRELDYVCLPFIGEDALHDCLGEARPYVRKRPQVASIDGVVSDVCGLRLSSCKAQREHSAPVADCNADHASAACGEKKTDDALCRSPADDAAYRCVVPCASSDDCKLGFACNDQQPAFCDFAPNTCYADTDCEKPAKCELGSHRCQ